MTGCEDGTLRVGITSGAVATVAVSDLNHESDFGARMLKAAGA